MSPTGPTALIFGAKGLQTRYSEMSLNAELLIEVVSGTGQGGMPYFAHISQYGPVKYGQVPGSIGVLESLDQFMPIGEATCRTWDGNGLAIWTIRIGKQEIPGRWIIVDREFRPAQ